MCDPPRAPRPSRDLSGLASHLTLATAYARGMTSGSAAATADNPLFLGDHAMIARAWEVSCTESGVQPLQLVAVQEEYFVGWVHGYVVRAEQIEGTSPSPDGAKEEDDSSSTSGVRDSR